MILELVYSSRVFDNWQLQTIDSNIQTNPASCKKGMAFLMKRNRCPNLPIGNTDVITRRHKYVSVFSKEYVSVRSLSKSMAPF
jgi:hypothetical protein